MFWQVSLLLISLLVLAAGAELLVRGAVAVARRSRISPFFVGLTIVGFGTSTPELCTSVLAGLRGLDGIAVGNVVGSNTFNIAVILGSAAIVCPIVVRVSAILLETWVVFAVGIVPFASLFWGGRLGRIAGTLMLLALAVYVWVGYRTSASKMPESEAKQSGVVDHPPHGAGLAVSAILIVGGLTALIGGSQLLVDSASRIAGRLGVSELTIGLTVVAAGTSTPELFTSLVAVFRKEMDVAVGNVLGSNIFNMLGILGVTSVLESQVVRPQVLALDAPVMVCASLALLRMLFRGGRISRSDGLVLCVGYLCYVIVLLTWAPGWFPSP